MAKQSRPPIITIMGHVDHGKTTLLDYIRHTHVVDKEAGGITQHIGAYQIEFAGKKMTFIDTPGHAAFNKMRERGAKVTDFVILVVAANDGVQPQTIESIRHILAAKVPFIVAINKTDLSGVYPDVIKSQLVEHGVSVQGFGGDTDAIEISAKTGKGVDELLQNLVLMADIHNFQADPETSLRATVIESTKDHRRGIIATVIVQQGTLSVKQDITIDGVESRVRQLLNEKGEALTSVLPGCPAEILGCERVPAVGSLVHQTGEVPVMTEPVEAEAMSGSPDFTEMFNPQVKLKLIIKADVAGTLEAILNSMDSESTEVLRSGVGEVNEDDLEFAHTTGSLLLVFHTRIPKQIEEKAKELNVKMKKYDVIYQLIEDLQKQMLKLLEPTIDEVVQGEADVLQIFNMKGDHIAGCRLKSGKVRKNDKLHVMRGEATVADGEVKLLMQGKQEVTQVSEGEEFGVTLKQKRVEFKVGDHLVFYSMAEE